MSGISTTMLKAVAAIIGTLVVIGFVFGVFNILKESGNKVVNKSVNTIEGVMDTDYTQYQRADVTGNEVINAISSFTASKDEIYIEVKTADGGDVVYIYPSKQITSANRSKNEDIMTAVAKAKEKGGGCYINPKAMFTGVCVYDNNDNDLLVGIVFQQN